MKENFDASFALTEKWEGGARYTNNPKDPGGPTKYGITIATLSHELGRRATEGDVMSMTEATAKEILRKKYWNTIGGDTLPAGVDMELFDVAVNQGPGRALQFLKAVGKLSPTVQLREIDRLRLAAWKRLRIWKIFGVGWGNREKDVLAHALKLAEGK